MSRLTMFRIPTKHELQVLISTNEKLIKELKRFPTVRKSRIAMLEEDLQEAKTLLLINGYRKDEP